MRLHALRERAQLLASGWEALACHAFGPHARAQLSQVVNGPVRQGHALGASSPPPRTKWTRRVLHLVLIGHAASLTPYYQAMPPATVARWAPRVALLNVYGTTEATVYQTARRVPPPPPPSY